MPIAKSCAHCGQAFSVRPAKRHQRYCSQECRNAARSVATTRQCEECGTTFEVTRSRELTQRFCSLECTRTYEKTHGRPAARHERKETTWFNCRQCGKPFPMKPGYLTEYRRKFGKDPPYCSIACSALGRRADADVRHETTCKNCSKTFRKSRRKGSGTIYQTQTLCSRQCKNEWVSKVYREKHGLPSITKHLKRGYVVLRIPASEGQPVREMLEHRYVMEQTLGRPLLPGETVHHRSGDKTDNSPENLQLFVSNHGPGQEVEHAIDWCIEMMQRYARFVRRRGYRLAHISRHPASDSERPQLFE